MAGGGVLILAEVVRGLDFSNNIYLFRYELLFV